MRSRAPSAGACGRPRGEGPRRAGIKNGPQASGRGHLRSCVCDSPAFAGPSHAPLLAVLQRVVRLLLLCCHRRPRQEPLFECGCFGYGIPSPPEATARASPGSTRSLLAGHQRGAFSTTLVSPTTAARTSLTSATVSATAFLLRRRLRQERPRERNGVSYGVSLFPSGLGKNLSGVRDCLTTVSTWRPRWELPRRVRRLRYDAFSFNGGRGKSFFQVCGCLGYGMSLSSGGWAGTSPSSITAPATASPASPSATT